jgi:hypothetical protein
MRLLTRDHPREPVIHSSHKSNLATLEQIMPGIFGDTFLSLLSPSATAQYRTTPAATFPNAPTPGPLSIPPAQPPIFLSPPDPAGAASTQPASTLGNVGQGLANGNNNHALTLMALGAGIAQGGVGKGLAAAATAAEAERSRQVQQLNFLQTYKALTDGGVPPQEAAAAISNPSLMRTLAVKYLGAKSPVHASNPSAVPASPRAMPSGIPEGSAYSPASWKAPDGTIFDEQGKPLE